MRRLSTVIVLAVLAAQSLANGALAQPASVVIGYQPGTFSGLPFVVATRLGLWQAEDLSPILVTFPAPTPLLMAAGVRGWDVAAATPAAAIVGAGRFELRAVALTSEEGGATMLMAPAGLADQIRSARLRVAGWQLLVPAGSAANLVARECLRWLGLPPDAARIVNVMAPDIVERFAAEQRAFAALPAPQAWQLAAGEAAAPLCSGRDAGVALPGFVMARARFARDEPETVRRVVRVHLRALAWIAARPPALWPLARDYYAGAGIMLSDAALRTDLDQRTILGGAAQRSLFDRRAGPSVIDGWVDRLALWLAFAGAADVSADREFLTDAFLPEGDVAPPAALPAPYNGAGRPARARVR